MDDLLTGSEPPVTLDQMIREVERELKMRAAVYPRSVDAGRLKQGEADERIRVMAALRDLLKSRANDVA